MNQPTPVLIAKRPADGAELFCYPMLGYSDNGLIRLKDGSVTACSVTVALEKMPFYLYDPAKVQEPYRRAVLERIQSGEAIKDWLSGTGLKIDVPPPQPAVPAEEKGKTKPKQSEDGKK